MEAKAIVLGAEVLSGIPISKKQMESYFFDTTMKLQEARQEIKPGMTYDY